MSHAAPALIGSLLACSALGGCLDVSWSSSSDNGISGRGVALAAMQPSSDDWSSRTLSRTFSSRTPLRLMNVAGTVEVETASVDEIEVTVVVKADAGSADATDAVLEAVSWSSWTDRSGQTWTGVTIPPTGYAGLHSPLLRSGEIELQDGDLQALVVAARGPDAPTLLTSTRVTCPPDATITVRSVLGDVRGGELEADVSLTTHYGDVEVERSRARLSIDTGSGDVRVGEASGRLDVGAGSGSIRLGRITGQAKIGNGSGDVVVEHVDRGDVTVATGSGDLVIERGNAAALDLDTGSGDIALRDVEFASFDATTGSGAIRVTSDLQQADRMVLGTGSGDVTIVVGPAAAFELSATTGSGRVRVGFDDAQLRRDGTRIIGATRGDGRTRIRVDTGSGDVVVSPRN